MITLSSGNLYYSQKEVDEIRSKNNDFVNALKKDFDSVSIALRDEALEREWCDQYNEFVDNVNGQLVYMKLLSAKTDYDVEVKIQETREQTVYISVEATSAEEAEEIVSDYDYSDIADRGDDWDWDRTDSDFTVINARKA